MQTLSTRVPCHAFYGSPSEKSKNWMRNCEEVRTKDRSQPSHTLTASLCVIHFLALLFHGHERKGLFAFKWKCICLRSQHVSGGDRSSSRRGRERLFSIQHRLQCFPFRPFFARFLLAIPESPFQQQQNLFKNTGVREHDFLLRLKR